MPIIDPKKEINEARRIIKEKIMTMAVAAFTLVAALAWNDAVQSLVKVISPGSEGLVGKFAYAIIVTVAVAIVSLQLGKISEKNRNNPTSNDSDHSSG